MDRALAAATRHLDFVVSFYREQIEGGRYFLHEHPLHTFLGSVMPVERLWQTPNVLRAHVDKCIFGAEARSGQSIGMLVKKHKGFLTNSPCVAETLNKRCQGIDGLRSRTRGVRHEPCYGKIASEAQVYPKGFCTAIVKGVTDQLRTDGPLKQGCYGIQVADDDHEVLNNIYGPRKATRESTRTTSQDSCSRASLS